jgi:alpha,alpha-trehalase
VSNNTLGLDVGVPARGLHGEAYRGHIFWDELFILPFLSLRFPELAKALLLYRYRRLDQARLAAADAGFAGAMFPWQSASSGREETQTMHLNPVSGRWLPDASHLQRHVNAAIVHNTWRYYQASCDVEFLRIFGAELILEIARFWASASTYDHALDRYEINGVMGPDEYHDGYPDRNERGLDNNAYTNVMAVWCLSRAFDTLEALPEDTAQELKARLDITDDELDRWTDITCKMRVCFHDGVISQFEGYELLAELDWDAYRDREGDISRLDRILESEGDSPNRYQLAKQADVVMLFYLLSPDELTELLSGLDYECDRDMMQRTIDYYEARTAHGSTLSRVVHSWIHARHDREQSWHLFTAALYSDVDDVQTSTTKEGIHLGAMAGTIDLIQRCYTGIETRSDVLAFDPAIPDELGSLAFDVHYRGHLVHLEFTTTSARIRVDLDKGEPITIAIRDDIRVVNPGDTIEVELDGRRDG